MENWVKTQWRFFGPVKVALLSDSLLLFEFSSQVFAQKAVEEGCHSFNGLQISLDWWKPTVGCSQLDFQRDVSWVRLPGLPLQLWDLEFFIKVGDACGGFIAMDNETKQS